MTWDGNGTPTLGAILYGNNYVGGVAGYNDEKATISNTSTKNLTISGQIVAAGKAVGGMIGLNCASTLPSATVAVSRVAGQQLVGGVIGANLPVGNFTVADGGAFNTYVASGRVEATPSRAASSATTVCWRTSRGRHAGGAAADD